MGEWKRWQLNRMMRWRRAAIRVDDMAQGGNEAWGEDEGFNSKV